MGLLILVALLAHPFQEKRNPEDPGTRVVTYEVDGTVHSAFITYKNVAGETKQKTVELPYHEQFLAPYGAFVYISGQKRVHKKVDNSYVTPRIVEVDDGRSGKLRVMIRVGGVPFWSAETEEAFGIAEAKGSVPAH